MKEKLTLGPAGVRALAVLCHHAEWNGNFAHAGKAIAAILLHCCEADAEREAWRQEDLAAAPGSSGPSIKRMIASLAVLHEEPGER